MSMVGDVAAVLATLVLFGVVALVLRGVERLWAGRTHSVSSSRWLWWSTSWSPWSVRSGS